MVDLDESLIKRVRETIKLYRSRFDASSRDDAVLYRPIKQEYLHLVYDEKGTVLEKRVVSSVLEATVLSCYQMVWVAELLEDHPELEDFRPRTLRRVLQKLIHDQQAILRSLLKKSPASDPGSAAADGEETYLYGKTVGKL